MTSDLAVGRRVGGSARSVRQHLAAVPRTERWLVVVLVVAAAVHGFRLIAPFHIRGDLLYHWGLTHTLLLGSFPPEGPYLGLPSYYPPGFHLILAGLSVLTGLDVPGATTLLGVLWLPVIPLGAFLLTRRLTGRPDVALLAAILTAFGGAFDLSADRLWVNSMFMTGQAFVPVYPRDLVFGLLPFAVLALLRAIDDGPRWLAWAALSGAVLGACGLIQVQLLLPIPFALATLGIASFWRRPDRRARIVVAFGVCAVTTLVIVGPWLIDIAGTIRTNGGVAIDSADDLLPVRIGFWAYPIQFGLVLPLAVVGAGVALLFLRRADGPRPDGEPGRWAPRPVEGPLVLVAWWIVPFALAVLYRPDWPLEDALRPQRLSMLSSQPALILAAMGLVTVAEEIVGRGVVRRRWLAPILAVILLITCLPTAVATERLLWSTWTEPGYAHLDARRDRVPSMTDLLDVRPPRPTVLTYEDWSSLAWYETGAAVVAVQPPGFAKLAFDPAIFTGHGQDERRGDLGDALRGDLATLTAVADRYGANRIVLARRGDSIGTVGLPATVAAARPGATTGDPRPWDGNGWDALVLDPSSALTVDLGVPAGTLSLEVRVLAPRFVGAAPDVSLGIAVGDAEPVLLPVPDTGEAEFAVLRTTIDVPAAATIRLSSTGPLAVQAVTGFVADPGPPSGWRLGPVTDDAIVWERST